MSVGAVLTLVVVLTAGPAWAWRRGRRRAGSLT